MAVPSLPVAEPLLLDGMLAAAALKAVVYGGGGGGGGCCLLEELRGKRNLKRKIV